MPLSRVYYWACIRAFSFENSRWIKDVHRKPKERSINFWHSHLIEFGSAVPRSVGEDVQMGRKRSFEMKTMRERLCQIP